MKGTKKEKNLFRRKIYILSNTNSRETSKPDVTAFAVRPHPISASKRSQRLGLLGQDINCPWMATMQWCDQMPFMPLATPMSNHFYLHLTG